MPVIAVMCGGKVSVMRGSSTAALGIKKYDTKGIFTPAWLSEITAMAVVSEPVPDVVGTTNKGFNGRFSTCAPE